jgi:hypothetical protein
MVDQSLFYGAPWRRMTNLYFEEFEVKPNVTLLKVLGIFIIGFFSYFLTFGIVNIKHLIYPHYKDYQKYLLLVAKNREGILTREDVQEMCREDSLDYVFIEYMLY